MAARKSKKSQLSQEDSQNCFYVAGKHFHVEDTLSVNLHDLKTKYGCNL